MENKNRKLCPQCQKETLVDSYQICPYCNYYFPLTPQERLALFADEGTFVEMAEGMRSEIGRAHV